MDPEMKTVLTSKLLSFILVATKTILFSVTIGVIIDTLQLSALGSREHSQIWFKLS